MNIVVKYLIEYYTSNKRYSKITILSLALLYLANNFFLYLAYNYISG